MKKLIEKEIKSEQKYKGTLIEVTRDTVELPDGKTSGRDVVKHPGAVAVVAVTEDNELILVHQFRKPVNEVTLEIPAGLLRPGEAGGETAKRELEEETGYRAAKVEKVFEGYTSPGYSNEVLRFYWATDLQMMAQHTDEDEFVEVELIDLEACVDMLHAGKIKDNKTMIGIMIAQMRSAAA
ncbi:ADP-ribose pyrophosphatase [Candidatus Saganbacteria bacterium CG08_land_8_20_14_0_20_45_16]|uniref:ADP-ribose pyrophosphatase n=1 Tax=Candidatus Saganbacteria bacterium CG08_land_8_20_14_0_20_45_16 TaxID=2014293 RepID=A0A2H0XU74_UNCSA|nr:MAG: ADP-ribose pyrophosphatase [Candidatus Saganbacteria bacterium CG08_land_8_20_14_0_20_45_16]